MAIHAKYARKFSVSERSSESLVDHGAVAGRVTSMHLA
jgi:GTP cyclohydrolase FolE2